ncbi:uncharacterized protein I206_102738 [Kwoniella pini CBS 10737]|uniref:tRNA-splicing endonuclease subunit Sen34 n=1 Tax=Kwoniella pini CBS 10737 TaxID=1296096 RepID=A0A1B9I698_9TREE|nr:uncharacterized protein I206_03093 [Kwoniella pini CBS 10737]OCF51028.1 hypothetical protein I206_03093 [Kwoniella pini CBS 10737]
MVEIPKNGESSRSNSPSPKEGSIPLYLVNGVATVWDAQVAATLHCIHNVSGLRAGTLPGVSQQNGFLGLPLTLMKEETAYLVQEGIAHLVYLPTFPSLPTADEISSHTAKRIERMKKLENEARQAEESKKEISAQLFEKGGEKARLKREARAKAKAEKEAKARENQVEGEGGDSLFEKDQNTIIEDSTISLESKTILKDKNLNENITPTPSPGYFLPIPSHPLIINSNNNFLEIINKLPNSKFQFPKTKKDKALLKIFTELLKKNYRIGLGPRFGGEYLIYPGDYLRYHAHFTSQILINDQNLKPIELVAWGRLGTGTKKSSLICCYNDNQSNENNQEEEEEIEFYSLEWANFG